MKFRIPEFNRFEYFSNLLLEEVFEGVPRIIWTRRGRFRRSLGRIRNRRGVLLHRPAKFEKRTIVFLLLVRDSLWNRLRAFKLCRRIEVHALLARMHCRLAARAFSVLIESRSKYCAATRAARPHH